VGRPTLLSQKYIVEEELHAYKESKTHLGDKLVQQKYLP
jgi:hypothetical protein